jgi:hypothetical protein
MDDFRIIGFLRCNSWLFIIYKWVLYNYGLLSLKNLPIMTSRDSRTCVTAWSVILFDGFITIHLDAGSWLAPFYPSMRDSFFSSLLIRLGPDLCKRGLSYF